MVAPMTAIERLQQGSDTLTKAVKALASAQGHQDEVMADVTTKEEALTTARGDASVVATNVDEAKASVGKRIDESIAGLTEMKAELTA